MMSVGYHLIMDTLLDSNKYTSGCDEYYSDLLSLSVNTSSVHGFINFMLRYWNINRQPYENDERIF